MNAEPAGRRRAALTLWLCAVLWPGAATAADYVNPLGMAFVTVPAGEFLMGTEDLDQAAAEDPKGDAKLIADEQPRHRVVISQPFLLGVTEVTQGQWFEVMGSRPGPEDYWLGEDWADYPVVSVSWRRVQDFIARLNALEPGADYRLPSEAQWEYAARAGSSGLRPFAADELLDHAWYIGNSGDLPQPVASRVANPWGLHDLLGNVWEWTADRYAGDYYAHSPLRDPPGPATGERRVRRGGSYHCPRHMVRPGYRAVDTPDTAYSVIGFRLIAEPLAGGGGP